MKKLFALIVAGLTGGTALAAPTTAPLSSAHDPLAFGPDHTSPGVLVSGKHGMVVSAQHLASDAAPKSWRKVAMPSMQRLRWVMRWLSFTPLRVISAVAAS